MLRILLSLLLKIVIVLKLIILNLTSRNGVIRSVNISLVTERYSLK